MKWGDSWICGVCHKFVLARLGGFNDFVLNALGAINDKLATALQDVEINAGSPVRPMLDLRGSTGSCVAGRRDQSRFSAHFCHVLSVRSGLKTRRGACDCNATSCGLGLYGLFDRGKDRTGHIHHG